MKRVHGIVYNDEFGQYIMPFMGADVSVVKSSFRSLSLNEGKTIFPQYAAYILIGDWYNMIKLSSFGGIFKLFTSTEYLRSWLLSYPEIFTNGVFSHQGPTIEQMQETSFSMTFIAKGFNSVETKSEEKIIKARVKVKKT